MKVCPGCDAPLTGAEWTCPACGWTAMTRDGIPILAPDCLDSSSNYDPGHFEVLYQLEINHPWFHWRNRIIVAAIRRWFPNLAAGSLLEVGCGTGAVLHGLAAAFPDMTLCGSEMSWQGLQFAARRHGGRVSLMQLDACRMPFREEFDLVGAFDVLEHIDDDATALANLGAAVRPGGGILLTVPQHPRLWSAADEAAMHRRRYGRAELSALARRTGLEVLESTSFMSLLLPIMWLARRRPAETYSVEAELSPGPLARAVMDLGLRADYLCYKAGIPLPVGGSRFVVLRKPAAA